MKTIAVLLFALLIPSCISLGYHQRKMTEMREADFRFSYDLAKQVREKEIRPADMRVLLRKRYNVQSEEEASRER